MTQFTDRETTEKKMIEAYIAVSIKMDELKDKRNSVEYRVADKMMDACVNYFTGEEFKKLNPDIDPASFMETMDYEVLRYLKKQRRVEVS